MKEKQKKLKQGYYTYNINVNIYDFINLGVAWHATRIYTKLTGGQSNELCKNKKM